jgi:hypothetical protein
LERHLFILVLQIKVNNMGYNHFIFSIGGASHKIYKNVKCRPAMVSHTCNPSYSEGQEFKGSPGKKFSRTPSQPMAGHLSSQINREAQIGRSWSRLP